MHLTFTKVKVSKKSI